MLTGIADSSKRIKKDKKKKNKKSDSKQKILPTTTGDPNSLEEGEEGDFTTGDFNMAHGSSAINPNILSADLQL